MRFQRRNGGVLEIGPEALATLGRFRQLGKSDPEAGGVLLGRLLVDGDSVVTDEVTTPSKEDTRTRFRFFRRRRCAQRRVDRAWEESSHTRNYLGEWHTHPEDHPAPSHHDRRNWQRILKAVRVEQRFLFFLIVGRSSIAAWEGSSDDRKLFVLEKRT